MVVGCFRTETHHFKVVQNGGAPRILHVRHFDPLELPIDSVDFNLKQPIKIDSPYRQQERRIVESRDRSGRCTVGG